MIGLAIATPFRGPGYNRRKGVTVIGGDKVVVSLTHAVLDPTRSRRRAFWSHVTRIERSFVLCRGFIGYSKRAHLWGLEAWTMSVWVDEASLNAFVRSDAH